MSRAPGISWVLVGVWSAWLFALQGLCASSERLGPWTPDLGLVFLLALEGRLTRPGARALALLIAAARIAVGTDPPIAVVVGYLGIVGLASWLRSMVEIDNALPRTLIAFCATLALASYWQVCQGIALAGEVPLVDPLVLWPHLVGTALSALVLAPFLARLPGISPLWRRRL